MTNQEYIEQHPEQFMDVIDKWLFTKFGFIGGCSSAQGSMEYSVARMVAEEMQKQYEKVEGEQEGWFEQHDHEFMCGFRFDEPIELPCEIFIKRKEEYNDDRKTD